MPSGLRILRTALMAHGLGEAVKAASPWLIPDDLQSMAAPVLAVGLTVLQTRKILDLLVDGTAAAGVVHLLRRAEYLGMTVSDHQAAQARFVTAQLRSSPNGTTGRTS